MRILFSIVCILFLSGCLRGKVINGANKGIVYDPYTDCPGVGAITAAVVSGKLLITEVSEPLAFNHKVWFELYNSTTETIHLDHYKCRSFAIQNIDEPSVTDKIMTPVMFDFPAGSTIPPGKHIIIRSAVNPGRNLLGELIFESNKDLNTDQMLTVYDGDKTFYWPRLKGFIELIKISDNSVEDFVRFGAGITQNPLNGNAWLTTLAASGFTHLTRRTSIVRETPYQDTNTHDDWHVSHFSTPAALNADLSCSDDLDRDNIPDCYEQTCKFYQDLPFHAWGARPSQTDIFVQVDFMTGHDYLIPRKDSFELFKQAYVDAPTYLSFPMRLHIDT